jgi:hypothetical protein
MESAQTLPAVRAESDNELSISRSPHIILEEARKAAVALKEVISSKAKKVMFKGEQYIEAEDWQTIGKFYNVAAKIEWTKYVEFGTAKGWEARAVVIHIPNGKEISAAEAMCLTDEANWGHKPLNQLRSMAQTRATSKALSTVLRWVVVMAGYRGTPLEEMYSDAEVVSSQRAAKAVSPAAPATAPATSGEEVTWNAATMVRDITDMLAKMNSGDQELMEAQLKTLTSWNDKETKEAKWLTVGDLPNVAKNKPDWLKGVRKKVFAEYQKAFDAMGNPK